MIYALIFYWVVAGIVVFANINVKGFLWFAVCLLLGGILIPARLLAKVIS